MPFSIFKLNNLTSRRATSTTHIFWCPTFIESILLLHSTTHAHPILIPSITVHYLTAPKWPRWLTPISHFRLHQSVSDLTVLAPLYPTQVPISRSDARCSRDDLGASHHETGPNGPQHFDQHSLRVYYRIGLVSRYNAGEWVNVELVMFIKWWPWALCWPSVTRAPPFLLQIANCHIRCGSNRAISHNAAGQSR